MAVNGKYLFGAGSKLIDIYSYSIAANGALKQVSLINALKFTTNNCGAVFPPVFLDHTGSDLYALSFDNDCANNAYQFFRVNKTTGQLTYFGVTSASSPQFATGLTITANNVFAYGAFSLHFDPVIYGFKRASNGDLTFLNFSSPIPAAKAGSFYDPYLATADTTNHVAISMQPIDENSFGMTGPIQLATYTVQSSGMLTTSSTPTNMPAIAAGNVTYLKMAPSGKLLAVSRVRGLTGVPLQRGQSDHEIHGSANKDEHRPVLLGQRESPVCDQRSRPGSYLCLRSQRPAPVRPSARRIR